MVREVEFSPKLKLLYVPVSPVFSALFSSRELLVVQRES